MPLHRIAAGIDLLAQREGDGLPAQRGDAVTYNVRIHLNRGDEVLINERQVETGMPPATLREEDGRVLVDHRTVLGKRQCVAGIEKSLLGMRRGGYRRVRIGPHLAYGGRGVPGLIPADAVLEVEIWLRDIEPKTDSR